MISSFSRTADCSSQARSPGWTTARTNLVRIHTDGTLDLSFKTNFNASGSILTVTLQADDKILIGGYFTNINGTVRRGIARLNVDGSMDATFNPGTGVQGMVKAIGVQADGRILVGGHFFSVNGVLRSGLARPMPNGALDTTFNPGDGAELVGVDNPGGGPSVDALVRQGDGRWIVGGDFNHFGGVAHPNLVRLNWDGTVDENFDAGTGPDGPVRCMALDSNGYVSIGGEFGSVNGISRMRLARIESDGRRPVLPTIVTHPADLGVTIGANGDVFGDGDGHSRDSLRLAKSRIAIAQSNQCLPGPFQRAAFRCGSVQCVGLQHRRGDREFHGRAVGESRADCADDRDPADGRFPEGG